MTDEANSRIDTNTVLHGTNAEIEVLAREVTEKMADFLPQAVRDDLEAQQNPFMPNFNLWVQSVMRCDAALVNERPADNAKNVMENAKVAMFDPESYRQLVESWVGHVESGNAPREPWMGDAKGDDLDAVIVEHLFDKITNDFMEASRRVFLDAHFAVTNRVSESPPKYLM